MTIVDLKTAKSDILALYFKTYFEEIPQQNLLFPLTFNLPEALIQQNKNAAQRMLQLGFLIRVEQNKGLMLLRKPVIIDVVDQGFLMKLLASMNLNASNDPIFECLGHLLSIESLARIPSLILDRLIEKWLESRPRYGHIRLSHEKMLEMSHS
jgi:hypothetical protein